MNAAKPNLNRNFPNYRKADKRRGFNFQLPGHTSMASNQVAKLRLRLERLARRTKRAEMGVMYKGRVVPLRERDLVRERLLGIRMHRHFSEV